MDQYADPTAATARDGAFPDDPPSVSERPATTGGVAAAGLERLLMPGEVVLARATRFKMRARCEQLVLGLFAFGFASLLFLVLVNDLGIHKFSKHAGLLILNVSWICLYIASILFLVFEIFQRRFSHETPALVTDRRVLMGSETAMDGHEEVRYQDLRQVSYGPISDIIHFLGKIPSLRSVIERYMPFGNRTLVGAVAPGKLGKRIGRVFYLHHPSMGIELAARIHDAAAPGTPRPGTQRNAREMALRAARSTVRLTGAMILFLFVLATPILLHLLIVHS